MNFGAGDAEEFRPLGIGEIIQRGAEMSCCAQCTDGVAMLSRVKNIRHLVILFHSYLPQFSSILDWDVP